MDNNKKKQPKRNDGHGEAGWILAEEKPKKKR